MCVSVCVIIKEKEGINLRRSEGKTWEELEGGDMEEYREERGENDVVIF